MLGRLITAAAWAATLLGALAGLFYILMAIGTPYGDAQLRYAVMGLALAVVPYVLAQACKALHPGEED